MDVLIAHGSDKARRGLAQLIGAQGLQTLETANAADALDALLCEAPPRMAVIDWDLPGLEGTELCRLVRQYHLAAAPYLVLLATQGHTHDVIVGLEAGANDCVRMPAADDDLRDRIEFGRRMVELPWGRAEAALAAG
jgi:DNA-binding response OmpR family regulator